MKNAFIVLMLLLSNTAFASTSDEVVNKFFSYIEKQQYEAAIVESFLDTYADMGIKQDYDTVKNDMSALITQLEQVGKAYGAITGYDLIVEKSLGKHYKRAKYVLYFTQQPVELKLALYAPNGKWGIRNIAINTYLTEEFEKHFDTLYE